MSLLQTSKRSVKSLLTLSPLELNTLSCFVFRSVRLALTAWLPGEAEIS